MDRVFVDANVLFSAAYTPDSRLLALWELDEVEIVTSEFALAEAHRNLLIHLPAAVTVLDALAEKTVVRQGRPSSPLPHGITLAEKDVPILSAAVESGCTHLLTGDKRHFHALYGRKIAGVLILTPAQYMKAG